MPIKKILFLFLIILIQNSCKRGNPDSSVNPIPRVDSVGAGNSQDCKITMMDRFIIDNSNDGKERQFPLVYKFGNNIFVSYSEHPDGIVASPVDAMIISRDNGVTWTERITNPDFDITSMFEKNDTLYAIIYFTYPDSPTKENMVYWTSANMGRSWVEHKGVVNALKNKQFKANGIQGIWGSMLFHRGMEVMEDGSIQGVMYGYFDTDEKYSVAWVKSTDNCATWQIVSVVASGVPPEYATADGYCEPNFVRAHDSSLLCVMRIGTNFPLFQSRSSDNGITWSSPVILPGLSAIDAESVDPQLLLMQNGTLALTYGRPNDLIAFSRDGSGYKWDCNSVTYNGQTTGYTGIVEISPGRLFLVADLGKSGANSVIWGRFIDVQ